MVTEEEFYNLRPGDKIQFLRTGRIGTLADIVSRRGRFTIEEDGRGYLYNRDSIGRKLNILESEVVNIKMELGL